MENLVVCRPSPGYYSGCRTVKRRAIAAASPCGRGFFVLRVSAATLAANHDLHFRTYQRHDAALAWPVGRAIFYALVFALLIPVRERETDRSRSTAASAGQQADGG